MFDDDANLEIFKTEMAWYFPFVIIPPATNAQALREEKPFLFRVIILAVTHHRTWMQQELWKVVLDYISLNWFFKGEKSMDLLQGLVSQHFV